MNLAWLTDIHLNFLRPAALDAFLASLAETDADAFVLTGDIGEPHDVARRLNAIDNALLRPVYFVLGNHDYYRGSIECPEDGPAPLRGLPEPALAARCGRRAADRRHLPGRA